MYPRLLPFVTLSLVQVSDMTDKEVGKKYDEGKSPIQQGLFQYFPRALKAVADVSNYGYKKYKSWGGWVSVPDGMSRYSNALARHVLDEPVQGKLDPESGLRHKAHAAWNALATLELAIQEDEKAQAAEITDEVYLSAWDKKVIDEMGKNGK